MIDNTHFEIISSALRIAPIMATVAGISFYYRSRLMFSMGFAGCFLGLFHERGGSTGGYLEHATVRANAFLVSGVIGASLGVVVAYSIILLLTDNSSPTSAPSRTHLFRTTHD